VPFSGWDERRLSDLIRLGVMEVGDGYRAKRVELSEEGLPFARAGNINDGFRFEGAERLGWDAVKKAKHKVSKPGDVVFTSKGTVGRFALVRDETPRFTYSPQLCFWRSLDHSVIDPRYLFAWMSSREFMRQVDAVKGQTDMADYVSLRDQRRMTVTLPPLHEQRGIAAVLGALDDKIELNQKMNRTLEEMAQAIFKSWFIDFDGVPEAEMIESELGLLPRDWRVGVVADLGSVVTGTTPPTKDPANYGTRFPFLKIPDMRRSVWATSTSTRLSHQGHSTQADRLVPKGSVAVSCIGTPGLVVLIREPTHTNQQINTVVPSEPSTWGWLFFALRGLAELIRARSSGGSVLLNLNKGQFSKVPVLIPTRDARSRFTDLVDPLLERIAAGEKESVTLGCLRDTLLPKLISGEIRVPEAENIVEAAV
jgi:type I restriction enzyme, S subunit